METDLIAHFPYEDFEDKDLELAFRLEAELNNRQEIKKDVSKEDIKVKKDKKKNRCEKCNKKTGLIPFNCECGLSFCAKCRYPTEHSCTFDWKAKEQEQLKVKNPKIVNDKVTKI